MSLLGTILITWCMVVTPTVNAGRRAGYSRTGSPEVGRLVQSYDERTDHRRPHELGFGYYYQGDIMLPEEQQDVERVSFSDKYPTTVWPNAIVPYYFEPGTFKPNEIYVIERSMEELQRQTCVRFIPRNPQTKHYVHITNRHAGCFASLGRQEDNSQNILNLQTPGCLFGGTPVHELMHTLGFLHEVSRADRDEYIYIDRSALRPEYQTDSFFATNFGKDVDGITTTYNISYNYGSIMHYSKTAGSRDGRQQVLYNLTEYDKPDFGSNHAIPSDIQAIKYRYCNGTIDRASIFSTLPFYPKPN